MPDNKRKNNEWGQLSMKDKAALIDIYIKHGFNDIDSIRDDYERNREHFMSSDANFVNRLRTGDTTSVDLGNGERGTHLMSYANDGEKATIYPLLQEYNGTIENHSEDERAFDSAIEKGDTVNVSTPFAEFYTPRYKLDYSNFFKIFNNVYGNGGTVDIDNKFENGGDKKNKFISYMDSVWNNVRNIVSGFTYKPKGDIDWSGISTSGNRTYNPENIEYINEKLDTIPPKRRAAIIGDIIEESGGNPFAESSTGKYKGLLQWGPDRALKELPKDEKEAIDKTLEHIVETMTNPNDGKSWTHGGSGSGYNSRLEPFNTFYNNDASLEDIHRAFSFGYVRPKGKHESYKNRQKVVDQVYNKLTESQNSK